MHMIIDTHHLPLFCTYVKHNDNYHIIDTKQKASRIYMTSSAFNECARKDRNLLVLVEY